MLWRMGVCWLWHTTIKKRLSGFTSELDCTNGLIICLVKVVDGIIMEGNKAIEMSKAEKIIDKKARQIASEALKQSLEGRLSLFDAIYNFPRKTADVAVKQIFRALEESDYDIDISLAKDKSQAAHGNRRLIARCILFLETDLPCLYNNKIYFPFAGNEQLEHALETTEWDCPYDQLVSLSVARHFRDAGGKLLAKYLGGEITKEQLCIDWPVPKEHLEFEFYDNSLRDIHLYCLKKLTKGKYSGPGHSVKHDRFVEIVKRCSKFLETDIPYVSPEWQEEKTIPNLIFAIAFIAVIGIIGLLYFILLRILLNIVSEFFILPYLFLFLLFVFFMEKNYKDIRITYKLLSKKCSWPYYRQKGSYLKK